MSDEPSQPAPGDTEAADVPEAKQVLYCAICTLPPEYCEFSTTAARCRSWLEAAHPDLAARIYDPEALSAAVSSLSVTSAEKAAKAEAAAEKRAEKEAARAEAREAEKAAAKVVLKRVERTKRKHVIIVTGLGAFGLDLKKVAKDFGKKFACGASVTKAPGGGEEVVVQGDLSDELRDYIEEKYKGVPPDNIDQVEDKKKKTEAT